jgi:hypothetical protein
MRRSFDWVLAVAPMLFAAAGCSDPVPNAAAVGLNLSVGSDVSCPTQNTYADDIGNPVPDMNTSGSPAYSGDAGLSVQCRVVGSGSGPYLVSGSVTSSSPRVTFNVSAPNIGTDGKGDAQIGLSTLAIGTSVESPVSTPCRIRVLAIQPGAVWAHFDCTTLTGAPTPVCRASGEFTLQNCSK